MSADEILAFVLLAGMAIVAAGRWYVRLRCVFAPGAPRWARSVLVVFPLVCLAILVGWLRFYADVSVRDHWPYVVLMAAAGVVSGSIAAALLGIFGIRLFEDVMERGNAAGLPVFGGICAATTALNVGANSGWGGTIYTTLIPLGCGLSLLGIFMGCCERFGGIVTRIGVGRDRAAGWRFGATLTFLGLLLAIPAAGDWRSLQATLADFGMWLPVQGVVVAAACLIDRKSARAASGEATV